MIDFRKFEGNARLFVMAVLFAMPWSSAEDLARLKYYSRPYLGKILLALKNQQFVFEQKAGHVHGLVRRWALTPLGVELVCSECKVAPGWPTSDQGLILLRRRMDLVEPSYMVLPSLLRTSSGTIKYVRMIPNQGEGRWYGLDPVQVPVSDEYRLIGFQWWMAPHFDAVAELAAPGLDPEIENIYRQSMRVQILVVRCGVHGKPPMEPDTGFPGFAGDDYDAVTMGFQGMNYEPGIVSPPFLFRRRFYMRPAGVVTITDQDDSAGLRFAQLRYGRHGWEPLYSVLPFDDAGTQLEPPEIWTQYGRVLEPADRGPIITPGASRDAVPATAAQPQFNDPIFAAVNGAMGSKVFKAVCSHRAVTYADIVKVCGKTDRASVRGSLRKLVDAELVASHKDIYFLIEAGRQLAAIRDGVNVEVVAAKFDGLFNEDGTVSRRWVNKKAVIAGMSVALQAEEIQAIEGWRLALSPMNELGIWPDWEVANPDVLVLLREGRWAALEYFAANVQQGELAKRLIQYSGETPRESAGLLAVCETAAVEREVYRAGSDLRMLTTTRAKMLRGPHHGTETIWRYRGYSNDLDSLWRGKFETDPRELTSTPNVTETTCEVPPEPAAETRNIGHSESAAAPVVPRRRRRFWSR